MALRNDVQSGAMNLKDKLSIELASDARCGKVTYGGHLFNAKVCSLFCSIFFVSAIVTIIVCYVFCILYVFCKSLCSS